MEQLKTHVTFDQEKFTFWLPGDTTGLRLKEAIFNLRAVFRINSLYTGDVRTQISPHQVSFVHTVSGDEAQELLRFFS